MKKKILSIVLGSTGGFVVIAFIILIPVLMLLDCFGVNIVNDDNLDFDNYVENNAIYADTYIKVANKYVTSNKGYVPLERILYFYTADSSFSFDEIYKDNLSNTNKAMKPISEVCKMKKYMVLSVCNENTMLSSKQKNKYQSKPFSKPINFSSANVTSFFKEERIIMGESGVHDAWDFGATPKTPVYAVCDGKIINVEFPYKNNLPVESGYGNFIEIKCDLDNGNYKILYGHLYPKSAKVKIGDLVEKGDQIANVGTTGRSTGNHLHYEVSYKNKVIDGMSFVSFK